MSSTMRILFVVALALVAFVVVMGAAYAQDPTATPLATAGAMTAMPATLATAGAMTATPATLPATGAVSAVNTLAVVLLAFGATAGLGGLLLRGLRQPR